METTGIHNLSSVQDYGSLNDTAGDDATSHTSLRRSQRAAKQPDRYGWDQVHTFAFVIKVLQCVNSMLEMQYLCVH